MSKFGTIPPKPTTGFGQKKDEGWTCYQRQYGNGTITVNSPKPDPNNPARIPSGNTTVTINAQITYYCQCEETSELTDGVGAFWNSPWFCTGSTSNFDWQRNITGGSCSKGGGDDDGVLDVGDFLDCTGNDIINIDRTISLAEFISARSTTSGGETCSFYYLKGNTATIAALIKCGATATYGIKGIGGDAVKLCFNVKKMAECLAGGVFACGSGDKSVVLKFITNYMDELMKDYVCSSDGFGFY